MNNPPIDLENLPTCEQTYWQAIRAHEKHISEQETPLIELARIGGSEARNDLLLYLLAHIAPFARRYARLWISHHRIEYQDLLGEASVAILSAMDRALSAKDNPIAFLIDTAHQAMREAAYADSVIVTPYEASPLPILSLEVPLDDTEDFTIADTIPDTTFCVVINERTADHTALHDAIRTLSDKDRQLVVRHFGLYVNAPEPLSDILQSMGLSEKSKPIRRILAKLCTMLRNTYPQYCSLTRESQHPVSTPQKALKPQEVQRLREAQKRLQAQNIPLSVPNLRREAGIGYSAAVRYMRRLREEGEISQASQEERLNVTLAEMQARGEKITTSALRRNAHVDWAVANLYLSMRTQLQPVSA